MRQWHVPCECLCDKHLLGEHVEHHMFSATIRDKKSIAGYIEDKLLWPHTLKVRHDTIASEMLARGMKHTSEYVKYDPPFVLYTEFTETDQHNNPREIARRCMDCRERVMAFSKTFRNLVSDLPLGGDSYGSLDKRIQVYISGKLVGDAETKAKAIIVMERTRKQMHKDGTIWL